MMMNLKKNPKFFLGGELGGGKICLGGGSEDSHHDHGRMLTPNYSKKNGRHKGKHEKYNENFNYLFKS